MQEVSNCHSYASAAEGLHNDRSMPHHEQHGALPAYMLALIHLLDRTSQSPCHTHRDQALDIDNSTILFLASTGHQQASLAID